MENKSGLDELRELNRKLKQLLDDPQPGLYTWRMALRDIISEINKFGG